MRIVLLHIILTAALILGGCKTEADKPAAIGEAFAGPISLTLRSEITPGSKTVATVKHGDRLEILQTRRRFVRVRTPQGVDGWTDISKLMTPEQMGQLREMFARAAALPSQGAATTYGSLNMHTEPSRPSPTFYQITEGVKVDVVAHKLTPRNSVSQPTQLSLPKPAPPPRKKKEKVERRQPSVPPPPTGPAPKPPQNWLELSKTDEPDNEPESPPAPAKKAEPPRPVVLEDWSLVRTKDGKAGWVLTRNLSMAIPDEVAQYSEGKRITSYFSLGDVDDEGQMKHNWLWTTIGSGNFDYDFDSFRVFIWNRKRHRYETAYIERHVEGYYPVAAQAGANPSFSLILKEEDGKLYRVTYAFEGYRVHVTRRDPWQPANEPAPARGLPADSVAQAPEPVKPPLTQRVRDWVRGLLKR